MSKFNLRNIKIHKDLGLLKKRKQSTEEQVDQHPDQEQATDEQAIENVVGYDLLPDEPDYEITDPKTIQEFIDLKKKQNQILEKMLESINKSDKQV